ncbi:uncharacterized protein LOC129928417 [Biomphalaria glabrata]|uniref:Uncharacterized protein LOC129928417 n=1 Tax=Biomphalaria glabrata TaxID=6526 RepID=A0A9W3BGP5_BIOGL|nr:uncharacterized protein LOC129928417 [Biomphalaria glabrata]
MQVADLYADFIDLTSEIYGNAKSKLSLQCSLDLTDNQGLKSLNPNLVAAKVSESMKNVMSLAEGSSSSRLDDLSLEEEKWLQKTASTFARLKLNGEKNSNGHFNLLNFLDCCCIGSSTAVQFSIQSNAVVCTSNAAEEIEIANSAEENHVYDSVIYTGYQTFQPKTSDDLTETINSNATSISDLSIQPETSESLTESIPTSIADQTFQPKTSESQTATVSRTSTCVADQTLNVSKCPTETDPVYINMACQTTVNEMNK